MAWFVMVFELEKITFINWMHSMSFTCQGVPIWKNIYSYLFVSLMHFKILIWKGVATW
jgi:hypothetical protein